ncbi:Fumarate reductase flavoprotein subunit [Streptomyces sp. MBT84]|nr:Fumarate reductase flavoprotein subunit [Streptomyces sp. MBT84]
MAITERRLSTMVLVIGTGGAGLRAAIELAEAGVDVLAVGKRPRDDAHTALAAGGSTRRWPPWTPRTAGSSTRPTP